ncbi:MAG: ATP-binding protein [Acidobacteriota bacterium]
MKPAATRNVSLLWRVLLSTSIAITVLFGALGWVIQDQFGRIAEDSLEEEVRASFQAYESLWQARVEELASVSLVLSRMPDIRAAFGTGDRATIRDTAHEVWDRVGQGGTLFLVAAPNGSVLAQVAGPEVASLAFVPAAAKSFPAQARGFVTLDGRLFQTVLTPVYVASGPGAGLLNVLVAGIAVDSEHVADLKSATGGSDFVFVAGEHVAASTLDAAAAAEFAKADDGAPGRLRLAGAEYFSSAFALKDIEGREVGRLSILRSFEGARLRIAAVRERLMIVWVCAVIAGLSLTYWLTRRLLRPVAQLAAAAVEIGRGNYTAQVPVEGSGEIAGLAESFNVMSHSLSKAREELIRQERISTIGRLSTSIIHDLRNPLAAIYGGSEMLVDHELSEAQVQRLSANIYRASRQVQNMLQELADVTQGRGHAREVCRLREVVQAAYEPLAATAEASHVDVKIDVAEDVELPLDRSPMERVFQNLIGNAIEAMPQGGSVNVGMQAASGEVTVSVDDTGPGIPQSIAAELFQPFVTAGKQNGVGLGLALSRKTVLSHGGDLWVEPAGPGARFRVRLPV